LLNAMSMIINALAGKAEEEEQEEKQEEQESNHDDPAASTKHSEEGERPGTPTP